MLLLILFHAAGRDIPTSESREKTRKRSRLPKLRTKTGTCSPTLRVRNIACLPMHTDHHVGNDEQLLEAAEEAECQSAKPHHKALYETAKNVNASRN